MKKLIAMVAALAISTPALADTDGFNRRVQVLNYSNTVPITSIEVVNEHGRSYDPLKGAYISPGYNRTLSFDDGEGHGHCTYTIRASFSNGRYAQRVLNVCQISKWNIYDLDNTVE